jgi:hypothetical protein
MEYQRRFRHHFSRTWLDRGGVEGDLKELNGWGPVASLQRGAIGVRRGR